MTVTAIASLFGKNGERFMAKRDGIRRVEARHFDRDDEAFRPRFDADFCRPVTVRKDDSGIDACHVFVRALQHSRAAEIADLALAPVS